MKNENFFKKEKLQQFVNEVNNVKYIDFPIHNPSFSVEIESPQALLVSTLLRAGYHGVKNLCINDDGDIEIKFNNKILQVIRAEYIEDVEDINGLKKNFNSKYRNKKDLHDKAKLVYVGIDKNIFLSKENPFLNMLSFLNENKDKNWTTEEYRKGFISKSGMLMEEFVKDNYRVSKDDVLDIEKCHDIFSVSIPTQLTVNNFNKVKEGLLEYSESGIMVEGNIPEIHVLLKDIINLPIYSINETNPIANYRDLKLNERADEIWDFVNSLIGQFLENKEKIEKLSEANNKTIEDKLKNGRVLRGQVKDLWAYEQKGRAEDDFVEVSEETKEIVFLNKSMSIINGQHSTTFFALVYSMLSENKSIKSKLEQQYNKTPDELKQMLSLRGENKTLSNLFKEKVFEQFKNKFAEGISDKELKVNFDEFIKELENFVLPIKFKTVDPKTIIDQILAANKIMAHDDSDTWINESKEIINVFVNSYNNYNLEKIKKLKTENKNLILNISAIKSSATNPQVMNEKTDTIHINEILPFFNAVLAPISDIKKQKINNLFLSDDNDVIIDNVSKFFNDIATKDFPKIKNRSQIVCLDDFITRKQTAASVISKIKNNDFEFEKFKNLMLEQLNSNENILYGKTNKKKSQPDIKYQKDDFYDALLGCVLLYNKAKMKFEKLKDLDDLFVSKKEIFIKIIFSAFINKEVLNLESDNMKFTDLINSQEIIDFGDCFVDGVLEKITKYISQGGKSFDILKRETNLTAEVLSDDNLLEKIKDLTKFLANKEEKSHAFKNK